MTGRSGTAMPDAAITRWLAFFCLWMALEGVGIVDLVVGAATAAAAAWLSLRLLPPASGRPRPLAMARLGAHFLRQSVLAGADVARRALDPALPLRPGFVRCPLRLPPGTARSAFCAYSSLLPGTLVAGSEARTLSLHCLDVGQDMAAQTRTEEAAFLAAAGGARDD
ncbi:MAG TPA: Na+/H+ antiporter subunit E [Geminicoccaceae bacterium]|nr:Na+/H+ antiporter subunit E [Geminicoccaceae bacterium]